MPTQRKNKRNSRRNSQKKNLQKRKSQRGGRRENKQRENKQRENKQRRNRSRRNSQKGGEGLLDIFGSKGNEITFTNGNNQVVNGTYKKGSKVFGIGTDDTFKFDDPELKDKEYKVVVDETGETIKFSDKTDTGKTGIVIDENVSYMFTKKPATTAAAPAPAPAPAAAPAAAAPAAAPAAAAPAAAATDTATTEIAATDTATTIDAAPAPRGPPNLLTRQPGNKKLINDDLKLEDVEDV